MIFTQKSKKNCAATILTDPYDQPELKFYFVKFLPAYCETFNFRIAGIAI